MYVHFIAIKTFSGDRERICGFNIQTGLPEIGSTVVLPGEELQRVVMNICRKFGQGYPDGVNIEIEVGDPIPEGFPSDLSRSDLLSAIDQGTVSVADDVTEAQLAAFVSG